MSNLKNFGNAPYFDDFDADKGFLSVLFRPGYPVQTRELNQLQTILQNQIGILGDTIFEDGSRVFGGEVKFNPASAYVRLKFPLSRSNRGDYIGATITNGTIFAMISHIEVEAGVDSETIYIEYLGGDSLDPEIRTFGNNQPLSITLIDSSVEQSDGTTYILESTVADAVGTGTIISITSGVFYSNSRFITIPAQTLVLSKYESLDNRSYSVGISAEEMIVTPETDTSLLDNATGATSESAPGAHRYAVLGRFVLKENVPANAEFIETVRIENQEVAEQARINDLSVINDVLAKRTYEESGDYVVDEFLIDIKEHLKIEGAGGIAGHKTADEGGIESKMVYVLDPGVAYVRGYSVETSSNTVLTVDKARTTASYERVISSLNYESFIKVSGVTGKFPELHKVIKLFNAASAQIGYAIVRNVKYDSPGILKIELSNIQMNSGTSLANATSANQAGINTFAATVASYSVNPKNSSLLFQLPFDNVNLVNKLITQYNKKFTGTVVYETAGGTNSANTIILTGSTDTFSGIASDYVVSYETTTGVGSQYQFASPLSVTLTGGGTSVSLSMPLLPDGTTFATSSITAICRLTRANGIAKTKTSTLSAPAAFPSSTSILLGHADVYRIVSVEDSLGSNITSKYNLVTGQTESVYGTSSITLKNGEIAPVGNVIVSYEYFEHGIGDYFVSQSYDIQYKDIPVYTNSSGVNMFLADYIDFRCKVNGSATGIVINEEISANSFDANSQIIFDMSHYLPRIDKIAVDARGKFEVISGIPAIKPEAPKDPQDALVIYDIEIPAYTFQTTDINVKKRQQRRYTMKDVGNLERRIESLEYYTSLNMLEVDAANRNFVDTFKSGFIVDNFKTQNVADTSALSELRCAFDLFEGECRPEVHYTSVNVEPVASNPGIVIRHGMAMLPYTEVPVVSQLLASMTERIQPFINFSFDGKLKIAPETDTWFSTVQGPDILLDGGTIQSATLANGSRGFGNLWGFWGWRVVNTVSSKKTIGETIATTTAIPYIRSRRITFSATGMKPHTRVYPYFDGVDVSKFCGISGVNQPIVTSGAGTVTGIFDIPNDAVNRFRTGVRQFVLTDNKIEPSTESAAEYTATGSVTELRTEIITTRVITPVAVRRRKWFDPLAQSFMINEDGGCFVSSINIFFGPETVGNNFDTTVQIRNMVNGYPGETVIASKTLAANQITGSIDATVSTKFEFDFPVHLEKEKEFCFVIMSDSETLTAWVAKLGQKNVTAGGIANQVISKQPYLGVMFKSQNNTTWTTSQEQDIKFEINRAKFAVGSGSITLNNKTITSDVGTEADIYLNQLGDNQLNFETGSKVVEVSHRNHGFSNGNKVYLKSPSTAALNGVPASEIFDVAGKNVTVIDIDTYSILVTTGATFSGKNGLGVTASQKINFSTLVVNCDEILLSGTKIDWSVAVKDKASGLMSSHNIIVRENVSLSSEKKVDANDDGSLSVVATLSNTSDNMSPMIDINRTAVTAINNRVDTGNLAQYVQKSFNFKNPANELRVFLDANIPTSGSSIEVQYRYGQSDVSSGWETLPQVSPLVITSNASEKAEIEFRATAIPEFTTVQIRVIMRSDNSAAVPRISNVRAISLFG